MVLSARGTLTDSRDSAGSARDKPQRAKSGKSLKQRISEAEAEITRITEIIAKIDTALALPDLFTRDPKQAAQLGKARAGAASALARAEEQWLEANSQYDEATG
jgi:ATP-binding cassette subfamily F protein 3